ncbi:hypothetical protein [Amycolatopsis kentuckyensis]|uniref:hypothetical protein n=1 Tax=Amycolatopsis kentuckyensis TaxID=218823 RepID=UPI003567D8ED
MANLLVQCGATSAVELEPGRELVLDRMFVTGGTTDPSVSRTKNAALLFDNKGVWSVKNRSHDHDLPILTETGRQYWIGPALSFEIVPPYCELGVGGPHRVGLTVVVTAADSDADAVLEEISTHKPAEIRRESDLLAFFARDTRAWVIARLRFQEYIPRAVPSGDRPQPLSAGEVVQCDPSVTESQVNQVQREIANIIGLDVKSVGPWLVKRGILLRGHASGLRHDACRHT